MLPAAPRSASLGTAAARRALLVLSGPAAASGLRPLQTPGIPSSSPRNRTRARIGISSSAFTSTSAAARRSPCPSPTPSHTSFRLYHSTTHPPPPGPFTQTESSILSAAYQYVPTHGFTAEALALGARSAGYLDISATVIPDGHFSLIRWHLVTQRLGLAGKKAALFASENENADGQGEVARRVEALTWERLMGNREVIEWWQEVSFVLRQKGRILRWMSF